LQNVHIGQDTPALYSTHYHGLRPASEKFYGFMVPSASKTIAKILRVAEYLDLQWVSYIGLNMR